jgi:hypothetical protein
VGNRSVEVIRKLTPTRICEMISRVATMNKQLIIPAALLAGLFCTVALGQRFHKPLSRTEKEHILDSPLTIVASVEAIPPVVKQAFVEITGERSFALANPGQKYQVSDVVLEPELPSRRLAFAGVKDNEWFIHYERGGIGHEYDVIVFKVDEHHGTKFLWGGTGFHGAKNLDELRKLVATGQFSDEATYYW